METRYKKNTTEEKYKFVSSVLSKMKQSTEHRKSKSEDREKKIMEKTPRDLGPEDGDNKFKEKTPRDLGPEDSTLHTRSEGPTVQLCGDSNVTCKGINAEFSLVTKYKEEIGQVQKDLTLVVEKESRQADLEH